ncbi:MAG: response regulator [Bacteroidota bacterium]|nr:response regulator [Bacteroidota bacterium]MDX5430267.1 response regulator [Bacteroidota bacterium]MDX5469028.1 response regulator [Bacteroidota bacterium]
MSYAFSHIYAKFDNRVAMKVVLVDDDSVYRFVGTTLLKRLPQISASEFYEDGESAIRALQTYSQESFPDFFFIDINMNALDGWDVLDEIAATQDRLGKRSKIFIVSSSPLSSDIEKAREHPAGLLGYILKPMGMDKLSQALDFSGTEFLVL